MSGIKETITTDSIDIEEITKQLLVWIPVKTINPTEI